MELETITLFVSSPGDVRPERIITERVIERMGLEFARRVKLDSYFWEHEPLTATGDFQSSIRLPSEHDIVICILWARLGSRLAEGWRLPDGSKAPTGTEFEIRDAIAAHDSQGWPDLLVYRNRADPILPLQPKAERDKRIAQLEMLDAFVEKFFSHPDGSNRYAYASYRHWSEFEQKLEDHLRRLIQRHRKFAKADRPVSAMIKAASWSRGSPFVGLRTFEFADEAIYHGRLQQIDEVRRAMMSQAERGMAITLIYGDSGSGKSSLARAGVMPLICKPGSVERVRAWRRAVLVPGASDAPIEEALADALLAPGALPEIEDVGYTRDDLVAAIRTSPKSLTTMLAPALLEASAKISVSRDERPRVHLFFLVDQLEQLFTQPDNFKDEQWAIVDAVLSEMAGRPLPTLPPNVWVLATMRSDFFADLSKLPKLVEASRGEGQYRLMAMEKSCIAQAIRLPALAAGLTWEENSNGEQLDQTLNDAMPAGGDALPLLQFTLRALYDAQAKRNDNVLRHGDLDALVPRADMRSLEYALATYAERMFVSSFTPGSGDAAPILESEAVAVSALRGLARQLATLHETGRQAHFVSRGGGEQQLSSSDCHIAALAHLLIDRRLLVAGEGKTWRVAHESIFRTWPRLAEILEEERAFIDQRSRAIAASAQWRASGSRDYLWDRGLPLREAKQLSDDLALVDGQVRQFISESLLSGKARIRRMRWMTTGASLLLMMSVFGGRYLVPVTSGPEADLELASLQQQAEALRDIIPARMNALEVARRNEESEDDLDAGDAGTDTLEAELEQSRLSLQEILRRIQVKVPDDLGICEERVALMFQTDQQWAAQELLEQMLKTRGSLPFELLRMRAQAADGAASPDTEEGEWSERSGLPDPALTHQAVVCWKACLDAVPPLKRRGVLIGLAVAQGRANDWLSAVTALQEAAEIERAADVVQRLAMARLQLGDWAGALKEWESQPSDDRRRPISNEVEEAMSSLEELGVELHKLTKRIGEQPRDVDARVKRAMEFKRARLHSAALSDVEKALSLMPDSAALALAYTRMLLGTGQSSSAASLVRMNKRDVKGDDSNPDKVIAWWEKLAEIWALDQRIAEGGDTTPLRRERAALLGEMSQPRLQERDLGLIAKALKDQPGEEAVYAEACLEHARALLALGELPEARGACEASLAARPSAPARLLLERIHNARPVVVNIIESL